MRRQWITGLVVVSLVGCAMGVDQSGGSGGSPSGSPSPSDPGAQAIDSVTAARVAQLQDLVAKQGKIKDETTYRVIGNNLTPDLRVQIQQQGRALRSAALLSNADWNVTTGAPVRATPATFGVGWSTNSPSDQLVFGTDATQAAGSVGVTGGTSNNSSAAAASTLFVLDNLYNSTPRLLYYSNHQANFLPGGMVYSFNQNAVRVYALDTVGHLYCYKTPLATDFTATTAPSIMSVCDGWNSTGFAPGGNAVTYSGLFALYNGITGDATRIYFGDNSARLWCVDVSSLTAAPTTCTASPTTVWSAGHNFAGGALGKPFVNQVSATENDIFIGDNSGNFYQVKETINASGQATSLTVNTHSTCQGTCAAKDRIRNSPAIDFNTNHVYLAASGFFYEFPLAFHATAANWTPSASVALDSTVTWTNPIMASPTPDVTDAQHAIYVTANNTLYKATIPGLATETKTGLFDVATGNLRVNANNVNLQSQPIGYPLPYYNSVFVNTSTATGTFPPTRTTARLEEYGCTSGSSAPGLEQATNTTYGVSIETGMVLDWQNGNLNFGYDTGNTATTTAGTGGIVQYPASTNVPDTTNGWSCPSPMVAGTLTCGGPGCVLGAGGCNSDADCSGGTPRCNTTTHKCVTCLSNADCGGTTPRCNLNSGEFQNTCIANKACTSDPGACTGTQPHCDVTTGSPLYHFCVACNEDPAVTNTQCGASAICVHSNTNTGVVTDTNYDTCQQCDANNSSQCTGGATCDTTSGTANFDKCVSCSPAESVGSNGCSLPNQVCSSTQTCIQCDVTTQATACPSGACNGATNKCFCNNVEPCPAGATCSSTSGAFGTCN